MAIFALAALVLLAGAAPARAQVSITDDRGRTVALAAPAQRIVSLLPSLTESVCALGACERLVGTDRHSNWPAAVRMLPKLGGIDDAQVERIVALKPDLVLAAVSTRAVERLRSLGLAVAALEPQNLADARRVLQQVAVLLGTPQAGAAAWQQVDSRIAAAAQRVPSRWRGRTVYFEVATAPYAAGEASFVGEVLARLGLANIVPAAFGPFPMLSPEFVVRAQPALIVAERGAIASMPARAGWSRLQALQRGHVCALDAAQADTLVRPGPRLADGAEGLADCLVALAERAGSTAVERGANGVAQRLPARP